MRSFRTGTLAAGVVTLVMLIAGCATSPDVEYYTLSPMSAPGSEQKISLAVGPADFPRALNRVQIMTRTSANRVTYDEFNRWAGTLEMDFLATAATNLSRLLGTDRIVAYPAPPTFAIDYRVTFDVQRFDADAAGNVTLETRWSLVDGASGDVLEQNRFSTTKTASANNYESSAAAHSAAVADLCKAIARRMQDRSGAG
jgi:hypothetical protein